MQQYRAVFSGLSTDEKPIYELDGTTFYETDTGVAFLKVDGEWKADKENPFLKLFPKPK